MNPYDYSTPEELGLFRRWLETKLPLELVDLILDWRAIQCSHQQRLTRTMKLRCTDVSLKGLPASSTPVMDPSSPMIYADYGGTGYSDWQVLLQPPKFGIDFFEDEWFMISPRESAGSRYGAKMSWSARLWDRVAGFHLPRMSYAEAMRWYLLRKTILPDYRYPLNFLRRLVDGGGQPRLSEEEALYRQHKRADLLDSIVRIQFEVCTASKLNGKLWLDPEPGVRSCFISMFGRVYKHKEACRRNIWDEQCICWRGATTYGYGHNARAVISGPDSASESSRVFCWEPEAYDKEHVIRMMASPTGMAELALHFVTLKTSIKVYWIKAHLLVSKPSRG